MDYYETLGVDRDSSPDEIKKQYRKLAREYHPDSNKGSKESEDKFKEISEAYETLSDSHKKQNYDLRDSGEFKERFGGFPFGGNPFNNIFNFKFENLHERIRRQANQEQPLNVVIEIDLEESFTGCSKDLSYSREVLCPDCKSGCVDGSDIVSCTMCNGKGSVHKNMGVFHMMETCSTCSGKGEEIKNPCKKCFGNGFIEEYVNKKIKIPKGARHRNSIRETNGGNQKKDGSWYDCAVYISVRPHRIFHIDNRGIHLKMPVPLHFSLSGGEIEIPTLHGVQKHTIPQNVGLKYKFKLKNKGFPGLVGNQYGDQHVYCVFESPKEVPQEVIENLKKMNVNERTYPGYMSVLKKFKERRKAI